MFQTKSYLIPSYWIEYKQEIKQSRFIAYLAHEENNQAAKQFIHQIKDQHLTATHHCWAYIAGAPTDTQVLGFSDDGEPFGTVGKPMLMQLIGSQIGEIAAVVVRYYGGIQLGTGGLVKAYSGSVQQALKLLVTTIKIPSALFSLHCSYTQLKTIETLIKSSHGTIESIRYLQRIEIKINFPLDNIVHIQKTLQDKTKGTVILVAL